MSGFNSRAISGAGKGEINLITWHSGRCWPSTARENFRWIWYLLQLGYLGGGGEEVGMICCQYLVQMAEAALADEWVINGDRIALQRRVLRLGKPPRRWKRPSWAAVAMREPLEVVAIPV